MTYTPTAGRILAYVQRTRDTDIPSFPLDHESLYQRMSGCTLDRGHKLLPGVFRGRFIDAVYWMMSGGDFFGDWVSSGPHSNHGYIIEATVHEARNDDLLETVGHGLTESARIQKERAELEARMVDVNARKSVLEKELER